VWENQHLFHPFLWMIFHSYLHQWVIFHGYLADVLPKSPKKMGSSGRKEATKEHSFDAVFDEAASGFMA
jgi:hypothetical protein